MKTHRYLLFLLLLLMATWASAQNAPPSGYIIHCGTLIDGVSSQSRHNIDINVSGNKITEVRQGTGALSPSPPEGREYFIDLQKYTCLPGLIDTHTHVLLQGDIIVDYDEQLLKESTAYRAITTTVAVRRALDFGFTALRDLETEGAGYADVDIRNAIDRGIIPGPHMQVSSRAMDVTGAYPLLGYSWELELP